MLFLLLSFRQFIDFFFIKMIPQEEMEYLSDICARMFHDNVDIHHRLLQCMSKNTLNFIFPCYMYMMGDNVMKRHRQLLYILSTRTFHIHICTIYLMLLLVSRKNYTFFVVFQQNKITFKMCFF